jgi:phage major head subunit gpT-like protein
MNFSQWLAANKYDEAALTPEMRKHLEAAWKAETAPPPKPAEPTDRPAVASQDDELARLEAESRRREAIKAIAVEECKHAVGDTHKIEHFRALCQKAIDGKVSVENFRMECWKARMDSGPMVLPPSGEREPANDVIEAAVCVTHRLPEVEKKFPARTLEAAHKEFKRGLSLMEMTAIAAQQNGYRGSVSKGNLAAVCRAAFSHRAHGGYGEMRADIGPSTLSVPGILSNIANKFLAAGFLYGEDAHKLISRTKTAQDFKTMTTYRLDGRLKFVKVPPGGEIKHGTLGELSYTNQVDTYGIMLGIDRRDFINDDLSAFTGTTQEMGRGAGDSLREVFWTEWLDDSAFFPTDKSLNNYDDGATDSVLSDAGLLNADTIFATQTKPDGTPIGLTPAILLVPRALRATAMNLMASSVMIAQGANAAPVPANNAWSDYARVVASVYLQSSSITGYSATGWYVLADPNECAAIEIAYLFGQETPIVETGEFDFDRLGLAMRGYMDFGVKKQEYRAAVKLKGAA